MHSIRKNFAFLLCLGLFLISSCKKDKEQPPAIPVLTTSAVTNITATAATSGGTITSNGGSEITASGICWSKTNTTPGITDDTTKTVTNSGSFVSVLKNLDPSVTYYIRAYATNAIGTGYGNVVTFSSGNAAPGAKNVIITGEAEVGKVLTATYSYADFENDPEIGTTFQWYHADDAAGANEVAISGANALTYTLSASDLGKFVRIGITPKSSAGTMVGAEAKSSFTVAVIAAAGITFTYNGQSVTYAILTSAATGRQWLDRNLGAPNAPTSVDDWANFGDLFQWGRASDGHQLITRSSTGGNPVNGTTTTLSTSDNPGNSLFIINADEPYDWRNPKNDNLWQGVSGINNPCPSGWRIPTEAEWTAENVGTVAESYTKLNLTKTGRRSSFDDGIVILNEGRYWTSTISTDFDFPTSKAFSIYDLGNGGRNDTRTVAQAIRCIKD